MGSPDMAKLLTRFVDLYSADPDVAESALSYGENELNLEPADLSLLQVGDNATHSKLGTLLLEDVPTILRVTSQLRRKDAPKQPLTGEDLRQRLLDALLDAQNANAAMTPNANSDDNFFLRGARTLQMSTEDFFALWFEHVRLQLDGDWEQLCSEKFDALENFQNLESNREDNSRFQRPDLQVALVRHFVATLGTRHDSLQKLEELDIPKLPQYLQAPCKEAFHCYVSGHRIASVALCAAIVEAIFKNIFYYELKANEKLKMRELADLAYEKGLLTKDDAKKAHDLFEFRNLAVHQLPRLDFALKSKKKELATLGFGLPTEDDVWMGFIEDARHLIKVLIGGH